MMKFVTSDSTTDLPLRHGEQYDNCSEQLLIEPDTTPLAALDPAILSCGLPAIVLDDEDSMRMTVPCAAAIIRYTVAQLLAFRKSPFSHRRPAAIDDPQTVHYPIWRRSGFERSRRASSGDEEQYLFYGGGSGRKPNDRQRDNGFNPPRFRRNHEFSNRNHHVIVKSYSTGDGYGHNMRLQDTIIEEEPEWVSAGPTSRLDTIELRGFDEDLSRNVTESLKSSPPTGHAKRSGAFYDELLHYEHVHPKQGAKGQHDTSGGADGESVVSTSNNGSPPPARSTPTKHVTTDMNNNNNSGGRKGCPVSDGKGSGCSSSSAATGSSASVNVSNFEEFMKFESMLGDLVEGNGSRFSKYFRRVGPGGGGAGSGSTGGHNHSQHAHHLNQHQQQQHHVRFALDRNTHHYQHQQPHRQAGSGRLPLSAMQHPPVGLERSTQQQPPQSYDSGSSSGASSSAAAVNAAAAAGDAKSFQRLLEMMAAQNQRMQQQQQQHYLLQLLQNSQQTEALRQVLMKKCSLEGGQQRVPTQAELQLHTQTIMKQALLRKKIAEQSRLILEQEPIPAVQQLIQSICPNVQRSLAVLGDTSGQSQQQPQQQQQHGTSAAGCHFGPEGRNGNAPGANGSLYAGGNRAQSRSASSNRRY